MTTASCLGLEVYCLRLGLGLDI